MFVSARMRHLSSASAREGVAAAVEVAGMASDITGIDISTWASLWSRENGLIVWSATIESLSELEVAEEKLAASAEFGDWLDAHDKLFDGPTTDSLVQVVHGAPDSERTVNVAVVTNAVGANGKMAAAMAAGVELADATTKVTGIPTMFATNVTGLYGGAVWISGNENLGEMEKAITALNADSSFAALVDQHAPSFQAGTETTWYRRLG